MYEYLRITSEGELLVKTDELYATYFTTLHFENFTLKAIRTSDQLDGVDFFFNISYEKYYIMNYECEVSTLKKIKTKHDLTIPIKPKIEKKTHVQF